MKRINVILAVVLFVMSGCEGRKQSGNQSDDLITVDVTANYPKKELILQDFMDVEYVALETSDEFLNQGRVLAIGKKYMLIGNNNRDGDIFIYDRNGKIIRKINRMGQGNEEYSYVGEITLDEEKDEMFLNNSAGKKILVYDFYGKYKRSINYIKDSVSYNKIFNYDEDNLICADGSIYTERQRNSQSFFIISKQDGSLTKEIEFLNIYQKFLTSIRF